ncbi:MAG: hypothetical protein ABFQ53_02130 [Patescibacteria group bacterium]
MGCWLSSSPIVVLEKGKFAIILHVKKGLLAFLKADFDSQSKVESYAQDVLADMVFAEETLDKKTDVCFGFGAKDIKCLRIVDDTGTKIRCIKPKSKTSFVSTIVSSGDLKKTRKCCSCG